MRTIEWFARNKVAPNLMSAMIIVGGLVAIGFQIKQEVFPEFALDQINVAVPYLGAGPEEVEQGVCSRIEEAVDGLEGVDKISAAANEGLCTVGISLTLGTDSRKLLEDVKSRIDAIDTFPEETEKPVVSEVTNRRQVVDIALFGPADESSLRQLAEKMRDELTALDGITLVEIANARPFEVSIEVSENTLRRYGISLGYVADQIRRSSLDLPGGSLRTASGEILLRTKGQAYSRPEFESLVLLSQPDGTDLRLGDVATVIDGFAETDQSSRFDGEDAAVLNVYRIGREDALGVRNTVRSFLETARVSLPEGIQVELWNDSAQVLEDRRNLLLRNGLGGLVLVFVTLTLFLRFRLAVWVGFGLFIAFMGTLWLMPVLGVTINLISLFAFILVLGIVVDDAIIVAESIYTRQKQTGEGLRGAIEGANNVARPVIFAVLTTAAAFIPLLRVEGITGKIMKVIPLIVVPCLLWSLIESLWILPAHLSHYTKRNRKNPLVRFQTFFADGLEAFVDRYYRPLVGRALRHRYVTVSLALAALILTFGMVGGGQLGWEFFPAVESDFISAAVSMPPGTPANRTSLAVRQLEEGAAQLQRELIDETGTDQFKHFYAAIGEQPFNRLQRQNAGGVQGRETFAHLGELTIELTPGQDRDISADELVTRWREKVGNIADATQLAFSASLFEPGEDVNVRLSARDVPTLIAAADELKEHLGRKTGVFEISDSFQDGKQELQLDILPAAEQIGLTQIELARQVRQAFYGEEAQRFQRGRDDIRVMVRYPEAERRSLGNLETMRIRTASGAEVPFSEVAQVDVSRGDATIRRVDRQRVINVTADVDPAQVSPQAIASELSGSVLPELISRYPGLGWTFEGQQEEQRKTLTGLALGFVLAMVMIYCLLAIPLHSYTQPLIIMLAIPFGLIGAAWGHLIVGMNLTILSMFGLVALTGVVVNDSLVMVDFINRERERGEHLLASVRDAGARRFRPILLTSLTTFAGLSPLMLEKSMQARFLIPMAVSLAFGVLFATAITLLLVPAGYLVLEDIKSLLSKSRRWLRQLYGVDDEEAPGLAGPSELPAGEASGRE